MVLKLSLISDRLWTAYLQTKGTNKRSVRLWWIWLYLIHRMLAVWDEVCIPVTIVDTIKLDLVSCSYRNFSSSLDDTKAKQWSLLLQKLSCRLKLCFIKASRRETNLAGYRRMNFDISRPCLATRPYNLPPSVRRNVARGANRYDSVTSFSRSQLLRFPKIWRKFVPNLAKTRSANYNQSIIRPFVSTVF